MTDKTKGLVVSLDQDIEIDGIEPLIYAIRHLKHVAGVTRVVADTTDWMARTRIRSELAKDFGDLYEKILKNC